MKSTTFISVLQDWQENRTYHRVPPDLPHQITEAGTQPVGGPAQLCESLLKDAGFGASRAGDLRRTE
jgi:hypothetical protein